MSKFIVTLLLAVFCTLQTAHGAPGGDNEDRLIPLPSDRAGRAVTRYYVSPFETTWVNAERYCRSSGRSLVAIEDDVEQKQLTADLKLNGYGEGPKYWISLNDIITESRFEWFTTGEEAIYQNWVVPECEEVGTPEGAGNTEANDCGAIFTDPTWKYGWMIVPCADSRPFICEDQ